MSTTHVRLEVMSRFNKNLPDYTYRRVSTKPLNPRNKADSLHEGKIAYFQEDRNRKSWNGVITIDGLEYIIGIVKGTEPLNQRLPINSKDEIVELTDSYNQKRDENQKKTGVSARKGRVRLRGET
ncbi:hypothetical protein HKBW3S09_01441, partial [Candidatus Hakubella thermalkaliphila]